MRWAFCALICLLPAAVASAAMNGGDIFARRCAGCHALDGNREGPPLRGVLGRRAGSTPGFLYSAALRSSHIDWTEALLDKWLQNTQSVVPDNDMDFAVPSPDERAALIAYLKSLGPVSSAPRRSAR